MRAAYTTRNKISMEMWLSNWNKRRKDKQGIVVVSLHASPLKKSYLENMQGLEETFTTKSQMKENTDVLRIWQPHNIYMTQCTLHYLDQEQNNKQVLRAY